MEEAVDDEDLCCFHSVLGCCGSHGGDAPDLSRAGNLCVTCITEMDAALGLSEEAELEEKIRLWEATRRRALTETGEVRPLLPPLDPSPSLSHDIKLFDEQATFAPYLHALYGRLATLSG